MIERAIHEFRSRNSAASRAGFTLLEMLVAVTLLALITALLTGSLRFGARVWETGEQAGEDSRVAAVQRLIFQWLQEAEQMRMPGADRDPLRGTFEGHPAALRFLGVQHGIGLPGGFYLGDLYLREGEDGRSALVLRHRPVRPVAEGLMEIIPETGGEERVFLENVAHIDFAYFGRENVTLAPAWLEDWSGRLDLPLMVRVRLRFAEGDRRQWPDLIVPLATAG